MRKYVLLNGSGIKSILNTKPRIIHVATVASPGNINTIATLTGKINLFITNLVVSHDLLSELIL